MNKAQLEEMESIYSIPSTFVDKLYITTIGNNARLVFVETIPVQELTSSVPRVAITMALGDMASMRDLISQAIDNLKAQQEKDNPANPVPKEIDLPATEVPETKH